jgi:ubiquinone/menaquinone biosynthesis C-methylase UbiE
MEMRPDYGIDAPGVRRGMLIAGAGGALLAGLATAMALRTSGAISTVAVVVCAGAVIASVYGFGMAGYMTYGSRFGKLRTREKLLDLVHAVVPWTGREAVLDVGCGRGLMLVGAARRLTTGKAIGIDLWRAEDQAGNTPGAAIENARREGVVARVSVETGDARDLPFPNACFDVVLSHWVVHNLPDAADRARAITEMLRVLRPGGVLVLADITHHAEYRKQLTVRGLSDMHIYTGGMESRIIGALSGGTFRPQAIVACKKPWHREAASAGSRKAALGTKILHAGVANLGNSPTGPPCQRFT